MLGDVLDACVAVGETRVATPDAEGADLAVEVGARPVRDPGRGQGAAVEAALAGVEPGPILVVNADLPCVVADDLRALLAAAPDGIALAEASDGTTNALSLPYAGRIRAAVRRRQRGAVRGARRRARPRGRLRHRAESRRRRRHARRPAAAPGPLRAADARLPRGRGPGVKVVVLSGGVGGARFVQGVVDAADPRDVTVVGNVGDDVEVLGLHVSPDLDSVLYALAGLNDEERGWGRAGESWQALETRPRARRRGVVRARRPRSRAPSRADGRAARRRAALAP